MIWLILVIAILFFIGAVFYKQSVQEFRINQISWDQSERLEELWEERVPIIVKDSPVPPVWTFQDVGIRPVYATIPIPESQLTVQTWVATAEPDAIVAWPASTAEKIAKVSSIEPWLEDIWISKCKRGPKGALSSLFPAKHRLWAGARGLEQLKAQWTLLFPIEGSLIVTLITTGQDDYLPSPWKGTFPGLYTISDTPYVGSIKFMDVILRPGHAIFIPAHWKVSWEPTEDSLKVGVPFLCSVDLHTPWSWLATLSKK